jgi:hypothetical protein
MARGNKNVRNRFRKPVGTSQAALACLELLSPLSEIIGFHAQKQLAESMSDQLEQTAACDEFLQILLGTVAHFHKRSHTRTNPLLALQIYDTVIEQYNCLMTNRQPPRSHRSRS